jgi:hypothetical protein
MGLFSSKPSRGGGTCPVCATSAERGAQMVKGLHNSMLQMQVNNYVGAAARGDAYFCQAAFAIQTAQADSSWSSPEKLWPSSVATLDAMRHAPLVLLSAKCWVCSERKQPALFKEFRELREAGRSILIGDPSVHCTLKSVCWMNLPSNFYEIEEAVTPIHTACAPSYGIHRWHMGKAV